MLRLKILQSIEETNRFYKLFQMAEKKHGFHFMNEDYFKRMQEIYNKAMLKIVVIKLMNIKIN